MFATNGYHDEGVDQRVLPGSSSSSTAAWIRTTCPTWPASAGGVATIAEATGGDPASSARWRDVIVPSGLTHELRAVFRDGRHVWGALVLLRGGDVPDFTPEESALVRRVAPTVAEGFRRVLVRQHLDHAEDAREAGILVLGGDALEIRTATNAARYWLDVARRRRLLRQPAHGGGVGGAGRPAPDRPPPPPGQDPDRAVAHDHRRGHRRRPGGTRDVGVVLQPSRPAEIAQIVGAAHGLTNRETDVVLLIASGHTNQEIARDLGLSPHTVSDHLKNVFGKLDVQNRGGLTSKLFHDYYLARAMAGRNAGTDGWFLPD